jgi:hypothetical protein
LQRVLDCRSDCAPSRSIWGWGGCDDLRQKPIPACILIFAASAAWATPVLDLEYKGQTAKQTVNVSAVDVPTVSVYAGGFNMKDNTQPTSHLGDFVAWCLDLTANMRNTRYTITNTPFSNNPGLDGDQTARTPALFDANFGSVNLSDAEQNAGFQIALWRHILGATVTGDASGSTKADAYITGRTHTAAGSVVARLSWKARPSRTVIRLNPTARISSRRPWCRCRSGSCSSPQAWLPSPRWAAVGRRLPRSPCLARSAFGDPITTGLRSGEDLNRPRHRPSEGDEPQRR